MERAALRHHLLSLLLTPLLCIIPFVCSEVFNPAILPRSPHLSFLTMGVVVEGAEEDGAGGAAGSGSGSGAAQQHSTAGGAAGTPGKAAAAAPSDPAASSLVFLYRLAEGRAAPSFGVHCAQLAGVPPPVLERARAVIAAQVGRGVENFFLEVAAVHVSHAALNAFGPLPRSPGDHGST